MSIFRNKHLIIAMVVTPILAILSYYFVDRLVSEKPQAAVKGQSYPLRANSNCRYTSGVCDLVNADFKSRLVVESQDGRAVLKLSSNQPLQYVKVGFRDATSNQSADSVQPEAMLPSRDDLMNWSIEMPMPATADTHLMLALIVDGSHYYAETTMGFSAYQTTFNKNFRD